MVLRSTAVLCCFFLCLAPTHGQYSMAPMDDGNCSFAFLKSTISRVNKACCTYNGQSAAPPSPPCRAPYQAGPTERSAATAAVSWIRFPDAGSGADVDTCAGKPPTTCSVRCATTFVPFHEKCGSRLNVLYDSADGTSSDHAR